MAYKENALLHISIEIYARLLLGISCLNDVVRWLISTIYSQNITTLSFC